MNKLIFLLFATCAGIFGATDTSITTNANENCDKLQHSIDSLNAKIDRLLFENETDNNPLANGSYKDWGTNYYVGAQITLIAPEIEFGYVKTIGKFNYGASAGLKRFWGRGYSDGGSALFVKLSARTPIYMNFMSFSGYLKTIYHFNTEFDGTESDPIGGGAGLGMESWISKNTCFFLQSGLTLYNRTGKGSDESALLGAWGYNEVGLGFRHYFGKAKKSSPVE